MVCGSIRQKFDRENLRRENSERALGVCLSQSEVERWREISDVINSELSKSSVE